MKRAVAWLALHRGLREFVWPLLLALTLIASHPHTVAQERSTTKLAAVKLEPLSQKNKGWALSAEFEVVMSRKLQEALDKGLPLKFAVDFRLLRPRWYWTDEQSVAVTYPMTLSYHALTRTYRLVSPTGTLTTPNLKDALDGLSAVSNWSVLSSDRIEWGQTYKAQVRFRLDVTEMPKPFQLNAMVNSEWDLSSDWVDFQFSPRQEALK